MRTIQIFAGLITLLILIGAAGATIWGPPRGWENPGDITLGNLEVSDTLTIGGVSIDGGDVSYDEFVAGMVTNETAINSSIATLTLAAYTNETAINSSITGVNATIAAMPGSLINTSYGLKNESGEIIVNLTADKGLEFGTGAALGALQVEAGDGIDLGSSGVAVDVTDIIATDEGLYEKATNNIAINLTEDGGLGFGTGADSGALIIYPSDGIKTDAFGLKVNLTANKGLEIGTGAAEGSLQIKLDGSTLAVGANGLKVADVPVKTINATTSISTVLTSASTKTVYPMDGSGGHVTLTLPAADTVTGREYVIVLATDMLANNVIVDTTGAGNLGGASGPDSLTTSDAAAALTVVSDGTNYLVVNKDGTWS